MTNKRNEFANILRRLADYIDSCSDQELVTLFEQAAKLVQVVGTRKKTQIVAPKKLDSAEVTEIAVKLRALPSREAGDVLLQNEVPNRRALETLARFLQLPVQRDDTVERLRAKIIENTIGSRLRSDAIQGKNQ